MTQKTFTTSSKPNIIIKMVGGNLNASGSDLELVTVTSTDSTLDAVQDGDKIIFSSHSNLTLEVPRNANLTIQFVGGNTDLENLSGETVIQFIGGVTSMNNVTKVKNLSSRDAPAKDFMKDFAKDFGKDFNPLPADFSERISRKVEKATQKVHEHVEEASRRAQKHAEQAARRAERQTRGHNVRANVSIGRWNWDIASKGTPPAPPSEPVTDEERMTILKMLQQKKISAEDAEKLLSALDGGK